MYARSTTLGILTAVALGLNASAEPAFTLESTGAVRLHAEGAEARYEVVPLAVHGQPIIAVSLGGQTGTGAIYLALPGNQLPAPGRYPIRSSWDAIGTDAAFHASFMAGTAGRPLGWFQGESGSVTITEAADGRITGSFELQARGFLGADPDDENQRVTVHGSFTAQGDATQALVSVQ
ncbi:MAG: hypothetical protein ACTHM9_08875 [Gemmatimonadales bacterium]